MILSPSFRKTIFISLLGHITVFSIFSFTFGKRIPKTNYASISFLGSMLRNSDLSNRIFGLALEHNLGMRGPMQTITSFNKRSNAKALDRASKGYVSVSQTYFKPRIALSIAEEKIIFMPAGEPLFSIPKRKEPAIMFYPQLPYHFLLYFKDRQRVHIELMFNIVSGSKTSTVSIKRKISSGNLEADLLSMRYISHYLFIQQARFIPNNWQTIKIDLSTKDK